MVETLSVSCNQCGAPLEVPLGTRIVTCNYCSSRLEVHRSGSVSYTSTLEAIQEQTAQMAEDLGAIRLQNELEQLDRQWALEQDHYRRRRKDGTTTLPDTGSGAMIAQGVFAVFFVIVAVGMGMSALSAGAPGLFALVPFGMAVVAIVAVIAAQQQAHQYADRLRQYEREREAILSQIRQRSRLSRDAES